MHTDHEDAAGENPPDPAAAPGRELTNIAELTPAIAAPSTEKDTHLLVQNDNVAFLQQLADDVERGTLEPASLVSAVRAVFPRAA